MSVQSIDTEPKSARPDALRGVPSSENGPRRSVSHTSAEKQSAPQRALNHRSKSVSPIGHLPGLGSVEPPGTSTAARPEPNAAAKNDLPTTALPQSASAPAAQPTQNKTADGSLSAPEMAAKATTEAALLKDVLFPLQLLRSLGLDQEISVLGFRLYLARYRDEVGPAADPVERLLNDQILAAYLRIGELTTLALQAAQVEFKQMYFNAAHRLQRGLCQLISTLSSYRATSQSRRRKTPERKKTSVEKPGAQVASTRKRAKP